MPAPRSRGQPPRPQYLKSQQPLCLTVDVDGIPSYVDQTMFAFKGDVAGTVLWSCLEGIASSNVVYLNPVLASRGIMDRMKRDALECR
jgi:hypothetical protein